MRPRFRFRIVGYLTPRGRRTVIGTYDSSWLAEHVAADRIARGALRVAILAVAK